MNMTVSWVMDWCFLLESYRHFGEHFSIFRENMFTLKMEEAVLLKRHFRCA